MLKIDSYKTVWVDLTDFIDWQGHFTGIQRVEYELASRFATLPNTKFFVYHSIKGSFHEMPFSAVEHKAKIASGEIKVSKKELKKQVRISRRLTKTLKEAIPYDARMKLVKIKSTVKNIRSKNPFEPSHPFSEGDVIITLGGNWAFYTFMPALERVKSGMKSLKSVHVIYDLIPVLHPGFFPEAMEKSYAAYIKKLLQIADLNLSISENTKTDAIKYAESNRIKMNKIVPFRLGDDFVKIGIKKPDVIKLQKGDFILSVGTVEVRKNHQLLYNAYKLAKQKGIIMPRLVIVGKKGWLADSTVHLFKNDPDVKDDVVMLRNCSDREMAWLYTNCLFTLYPSYYEGWGLPIAESLNYGKLCLASNTSSMPEVGGDIVEYYSPYDSGELLDKIIKNLNKVQLKIAEDRIKKHYKPTKWDRTFREVVDILNKELWN